MSTTEKLFVHIFQKKQSIVDQVRREAELFDQHLASKLLIRGIHPPSWLLSPAFHPQTSNRQLQDLRKEELISGILLTSSRPSTSYSDIRCSLCDDPFITAGTEEFLGGFFSKNFGANHGLEAGDTSVALSHGPVAPIECAKCGLEADNRSSLAPQNPVGDVNCPFNSHTAAFCDSSPAVPFCDAIIPAVFSESHPSIESIQRSKSYQGALELHSSAKAMARSCSNGAKKTGIDSNGIFVSGLDFQQPKGDTEPSKCALSLSNTNNRCAFKEGVIENCQSQGRCNDTKEKFAGTGRITEPQSCQHPNIVNECLGACASIGVSSPVYLASSPAAQTDASIRGVYSQPHLPLESIQRSKARQRALVLRNNAKAMTRSCSNEAKNTGVNCKGIIGTRLDFQQPNDVSGSLDCAKSLNKRNNRYGVTENRLEDSQNEEQCNNTFSDRTTEPESYHQHQLNSVNESLNGDVSFDIFRGIGAMQQQSVGKSMLLSGSVGKSFGVREAKIVDSQSSEEDKCVSSEGSDSKLNCLPDSSCAMLKEDCSNLSQSFDISAQQPKQITVNPLDGTSENFEAREAQIGQLKSKEKSDTHSGRITRSRSTCISVSSEGSYLKLNCRSDSPCAMLKEDCSNLSQSFDISAQQPKQITVNPIDGTSENFEAREAQIGQIKSKEKGDTHSGRITRSRSACISVSSEGSYLKRNCLPDSPCAMLKEDCSNLSQSFDISAQQPKQITVNPLDGTSESFEAREAQIGQLKSQEKSDTYSGRIARSRSACISVSSEGSYLKINCLPDSPCAMLKEDCSNLSQYFDISAEQPKKITVNPLDGTSENFEAREAQIGQFKSKEKSETHSCRITRSRSACISVSPEGSYLKTNCPSELKSDSSCSKFEEECTNLSQSFGNSVQYVNANPLDETNKVFEMRKDQVGEFKRKEKNNTYSGRITRFRSACVSVSSEGSYLKPNCLNELLKPDSCCAKFEEECSTPVHSLVKSHQQLKHVSVNPIDEISGSCDAREALIEDFKSKEKSNTYSDQITRSRSACIRVSSEDSYQKPSRASDLLKVGSSCAKFDKNCNALSQSSGKSVQQHKKATENPSDESNVNFEAREAQIKEFESKEMSNTYSGRMTRSRSACKDLSFANTILKPDGCFSEPSELHFPKKSSQPSKIFSTDIDGSWPQCKRRKINDVLSNAFGTALSQGAKPRQYLHGGTSNGCINSTVDNPVNLEAVVNLEHFSLSCEQGGSQLNVDSPDLRIDQNVACHMMGGSASSPKRQKKLGGSSFERTPVSVTVPNLCEDSILGLSCSSSKQPTGDPQSFMVERVRLVDPAIVQDISRQCPVNDKPDMVHSDDRLNLGHKVVLSTAEKNIEGRKSFIAEDASSSHGSVGYPHKPPNLDLVCTGETMSIFEGFIMPTENGQPVTVRNGICFDELELSTSAVECATVLEQLRSSTNMHTPLSQLSNPCKLHYTPELHSSVPSGLLEDKHLRSTFHLANGSAEQLMEQLRSSTNILTPLSQLSNACKLRYTPELHKSVPCGLLEDKHLRSTFHLDNGSGEQLMAGHTEHKSFSDPLAWAIRSYASPVGQPWERVKFRFNSASSEKQKHFNPELTCFPIEEEGNGGTYEVADTSHNGNSLEKSAKHGPLAEIEEDFPEAPPLVSELACRMSVDSSNTQINFTGTHNGVAKKVGNHHKSRRYMKDCKENQCLSVSTNGIKRASESLRNQANKKTLSETTHKRNEGPFLERASKHNNIVSNVTSFVPLVQQKQAVATFTGKRDVKVKALEAAEAAKHLEVKREHQRKMKKEAMKLHQQEKLEQKRQLEKMKKNKEEKRKKMDADMATKKRQREEEERKEKERKRRHLEGAKKQQKEDKEMLHVKKEKSQVLDGRHQATKKSEREAKKHENMIKERIEGNYEEWTDIESSIRSLSMYDDTKNRSAVENCDGITDWCNIGKVTGTSDIQNGSSTPTTMREQSYELSPYQDSDDEDQEEEEEEDDIPNTKFVPSWASKSSLGQAVHWQQKFDQDLLFPLECSCHIDEPLLPRQQHPL